MDAEIKKLQEAFLDELPAKAAPLLQTYGRAYQACLAECTPDWKALEEHLHKLAGSSGTYGLNGVSKACRTLEEQIADGTVVKLNFKAAAQALQKWKKTFEAEITAAQSTNRKGQAA